MHLTDAKEVIQVPKGLNLRVTRREVEAICRDALGTSCRPTDVTYIPGGLNNAAFRVDTNGGFPVVLRVILDSSPPRALEKEIAVYEVMRRHGIPVPEVLKAETRPQTLRYAFVLSTYIRGDSLSDAYPRLTETQKNNVYEELGDYVGRLHAISFDAFGEPHPAPGGVAPGPIVRFAHAAAPAGPFSSWSEMFNAIVGQQIESLRGTAFDEELKGIVIFLERQQHFLEKHITPRLLHLDLHMGNIRVNGASVTGLLDPADSLIGHNEYCLMRLELANFRDEGVRYSKSFFASYCKHVPMDALYEERKPLYELSRHLVAMRCAIEFGGRYAESIVEVKVNVHRLLKA